MKKSALIIIDMQVGAVEMTEPKFYALETVIHKLEKLIRKARIKGIPIYYAQHHNPNGFPEYGSSKWELISQIAPQDEDRIIHKTTPDIFLDTNLHLHLEEQEVKRVVIGGIQTAECVDTSCRRAFSLGYEVVLIKDGHTTFDTQILKAEQAIAHHNQIIGNWFGKVIESEKIEF